MQPESTVKPRTRKRRRSREFMDAVGRCEEVGMSFIDAVRNVDSRRDEIESAASERNRETMRLDNQRDTWNATVPAGTPVMFRSVVGGPELPSKTRSKAWFACGHNLVLIDGKAGGWNLDFVRATQETSNAE